MGLFSKKDNVSFDKTKRAIFEDQLRQAIDGIMEGVYTKVQDTLDAAGVVEQLEEKISTLSRELTDMEIRHDKRIEEFEREKRETEHLVGLQKKQFEMQVEHERKQIEIARQQASMEVREENLKESKDRFEDQLQFHEKRFSEEVGYLKEMIGTILNSLPNVNMTMEHGTHPKVLSNGEQG